MTLEPNPGLAAVLRQAGYAVVKVQPPDGAVLELPDGTRYCVTVHRG